MLLSAIYDDVCRYSFPNFASDSLLCHAQIIALQAGTEYALTMTVMVSFPDALAARFGADLPRRALEALVLEEYRAGRLTNPELRELLGLQTRHEMDGFLKARGIYEDFTLEEIENQVRAVERLGF